MRTLRGAIVLVCTGTILLSMLCASWGVFGAEQRKVTLRVYLKGAASAEYEWQKQVFKDFEKENPDIKLEIIAAAGDDYLPKLATLWASGNPPDVWGEGGDVATYVHRGWLLDLTSLIKRDQAELQIEDFFPGAWKMYQWGDHIWGIPFMSMPTPLWYNVDIVENCGLEAPPVNWDDPSWTWDKMADYARKMTRKDATGKVQQTGIILGYSGFMIPIFSWMWGGDLFDTETYMTGFPNKCILSSVENERGFQKAVDLRATYGMPIMPFSTGKSGMAIGDGPWIVLGVFGRSNLAFRWGMAPMPKGTERATVVFTDPWMISSKTRHPEEAWRLVKYMTSARTMTSYARFSVYPPARRSAFGDYLERLARFSGYHKPQEILMSISGGHKYGRESLDHIVAGWWTGILPKIQPVLNAMWGLQKSVKEALLQAQAIADGEIRAMRGNR